MALIAASVETLLARRYWFDRGRPATALSSQPVMDTLKLPYPYTGSGAVFYDRADAAQSSTWCPRTGRRRWPANLAASSVSRTSWACWSIPAR